MNIFYIITVLILLTVFFLINKSNKKLNGLTWIIFSISLYLCFNTFLVFILYFIKIPSTLFSLSVVNLICSFLLFYFKICNKKLKGKKVVQKYYFNVKEFMFALLIVGIISIIGYFRFNNMQTINYETTDPAVHYKVANTYAETNELLDLDNSSDEMYDSFNRSMTGAYINGGTFIRVLNFMDSHNAFIIYDIFMFLMSGLLFFVTGLEIKSNKKNSLILFVLTVLYILGYPLNNMLFGFYYLGIGVFMVNLIFITINMLKNKDLVKFKSFLIFILALFNYCLFFSYYLFVPVFYLAEGLYLIYNYIKKKIDLKNTLKYGIVTLVVPFVIGFCYFILAGFLSSNEVSQVSALAIEGYIYRDLLSNFILVSPLFLYSFFNQIKQKDKSYNIFAIVVLFVFTLFVFVLGMKDKASSYYYFKLYFPMWLIFYLNIVEILNFEDKQSKTILVSNLLLILFVLFVGGVKLESKVQEKNILFSPSTITRNLTDIYVWNGNRIFEERPVFSVNEFEVIKESEKYLDKCVYNKEFPMVANYLQKLWYYSIYDVVPIYNHGKNQLSQFYEEKFDYKNWRRDDNSQCLILLNSSNNEESDNYIDFDYSDYNILFSNSEGSILIKK